MGGLLRRLKALLGATPSRETHQPVGKVLHLSWLGSPELAARLPAAPEAQQRRAALSACEFALAKSGLEHPLVDEAMAALRDGRPVSPAQRENLQRLVDELDARSDGLRETAEEAGTSEEEADAFFSQARAAQAVCFATGDDALEAAVEAVYEAKHTYTAGTDGELKVRDEEFVRHVLAALA